MGDPDINPEPDDAGRAFRRVLGWGGAMIVSLLVWAMVFWLIGQGLDRQRQCADQPEAASCPSPVKG